MTWTASSTATTGPATASGGGTSWPRRWARSSTNCTATMPFIASRTWPAARSTAGCPGQAMIVPRSVRAADTAVAREDQKRRGGLVCHGRVGRAKAPRGGPTSGNASRSGDIPRPRFWLLLEPRSGGKIVAPGAPIPDFSGTLSAVAGAFAALRDPVGAEAVATTPVPEHGIRSGNPSPCVSAAVPADRRPQSTITDCRAILIAPWPPWNT